MTNKIKKRILIKAEITLVTPALIGSGESENTDNDVLLNSEGNPFLPGTAVAGVLRALLPEAAGNTLCGSITNEKMSSLWTYDAPLKKKDNESADIVSLDGVAIDAEKKVAIPQAKYDFEAVAEGAVCALRLELVLREKDTADLEDNFKKLLAALAQGKVSVGAKTHRGFGKLSCRDIYRKEFDFEQPDTLTKWLDFDWETAKWTDDENVLEALKKDAVDSDKETLTAELKLNGSIMIRDIKNLSAAGEDYAHISSDGKPVIFGTSWAGAFKNGLKRILGATFRDSIDCFFGANDPSSKKTTPSKVNFEVSHLKQKDESIEGYRLMTRTKIDRFTGSAADGALFTERPWYGGTCDLVVHYPKDCPLAKELLLLGVEAIDKGIITIGGETAVGRGYFNVEKVSIEGVEVKRNDEKPAIAEMAKHTRGGAA